MSRTVLKISALLRFSMSLMIVMAVVLMTTLFGKSLSPSEEAKSNRSKHDVSNLKNGVFRFDDFNRAEGSSVYSQLDSAVLLFKTQLGELRVFVLPSKQGAIALPDRFMGGDPVHYCQDFRPTFTEDALIQCHDADMQKWNDNLWVWDLKGKSAYFAMDDLWAPDWELIGQTVYINL